MSVKPIVVAVMWVIAFFPAAVASDPAESPSDERQQSINLESFDRVWTTIRDSHWDPEMGGIDWDAVRDELRPKVEQATDRAAARAVMDEMISRLELSHYSIIPAEAYELLDLPEGQGAQDGWAGIDVRVVDGRALVTSVAEGSPAAEAGVRPGWEVARIGDDEVASSLEPIEAEFEETLYLDYVLASVVMGRLRGPVGDEIALALRDGTDRNVEIDVTLAEQRGEKVRMGYMPPRHVWIDTAHIDETVGYVAFNMFIDPGRLMPVFNEAMESFMEADGLVIDLRGNPGGMPGMAMGMAGWLISDLTSPSHAAMRDEVAKTIEELIDKMDSVDREVLILRFLDELSYHQIAEITGCEIGTVKSRVHYGKRALKNTLELEPEQ